MKEDINEITRRIIGCAMQLHNFLGNGFQEVIYQRALAIEMRLNGLSFEREMEMPIFYREEHIVTIPVQSAPLIPVDSAPVIPVQSAPPFRS